MTRFGSQQLVSTSKFLSLVLRHNPQAIGMELSSDGWLPIESLIANANAHGHQLTLELLHEVVENNDKQRFGLSDDGLRIRANQGHSIREVELALTPAIPPESLFHGTVEPFLSSIHKEGLRKRSRNHVHLSSDIDTALAVGSRRGSPVILTVAARTMYDQGHCFYLSANGVWLTESVPVEFLTFP